MLALKSKTAGVIAALAMATGVSTYAFAQGATHEVTITVLKVKNLDKVDEFSKGDDYAKATIGSETVVSPTVSGKTGTFTPAWKLTAKVPAGEVKVKLQLLDKDVSVDDPIDINRVDNKRDLDFTVNTRSCRLEGFSNTYKCGSQITRAGTEKKKAEITFSVSVKKL